MSAPRGLRNNNPGNIIKSNIDWPGKISSPDESRFEVFDTPEHGLEAACKLLLSYQDRHGLDTIREMINRWAPTSENDTSAYVQAVANETGIGADLQLDLHRVPATLAALCAAIVQHENGQQPYPEAMIINAAKVALGQQPGAAPATPAAPTPAPAPEPPKPAAPAAPEAAPPAPASRQPRGDEEFPDIPAADLAAYLAQFRAVGATVITFTKQADRLWSVLAHYGS